MAAKDRELKSCNRRSDELSTKLDIIRKWCEWLIQPPGSQVSRPDRSPYFENDEVRPFLLSLSSSFVLKSFSQFST